MSLAIQIACPAPAGSRQGNRVTAERWSRRLGELGHRVHICHRYVDEGADVLVALHARRSATAVRSFRRQYPERPVVLALTGTDLYRDLSANRTARQSLELADALVVLHDAAPDDVPVRWRDKVHVVHQSAEPARQVSPPSRSTFDVCVLGHLRYVKDPLRAAMAARLLPPESRIRVLHVGRALTTSYGERAEAENERNPRYRWLGERSHEAAKRLLARSRLLVVSSRMEGGANVVGEAAVTGVPVLATRIAGNVGLLGTDYPGFFNVGDTQALAALMLRAETNPLFHRRLAARMRQISRRFDPAAERRAWRRLLADLIRRA